MVEGLFNLREIFVLFNYILLRTITCSRGTPRNPRTSVWEPLIYDGTCYHTTFHYRCSTRPSPPLCVRGKEEFNPTVSGRSPQSLGAPSLQHLLCKQRNRGNTLQRKKERKKKRFYVSIKCNSVIFRRGKHVNTCEEYVTPEETLAGKLQANLFYSHFACEGLRSSALCALCPLLHFNAHLIQVCVC